MASSHNRGPTIIGVTILFWIIAAIALGMRFSSMRIRKRKMLAHDIFIMLGFTLATALAITVIVTVENGGLGQHAIKFADQPWKLVTFGKLSIVAQLLWCLSTTCVRVSVLSLYTHLFSLNTRFRIACIIMITICGLWAIGETLLVFLLCRPFAFNWDKSIHGHCGSLNEAYLAVHGSNFIIDTTIALLPMPVLWGLRMPLGRKIGIIAMFSLGALICAIAIARIALYQLALNYDSADFTWSGSLLFLFTSMEPLIGCTLACMPLLQPLADVAASSSVVSWAKSWIRTPSKGGSEMSTDRNNYLSTGNSDRFNQVIHVITGGNKGWPIADERGSGENKIYVNTQFEHNSFEMIENTIKEPDSAVSKSPV